MARSTAIGGMYLGEINDSQKESWCKTIELFEEGQIEPPGADDRSMTTSVAKRMQGWLNKVNRFEDV